MKIYWSNFIRYGIIIRRVLKRSFAEKRSARFILTIDLNNGGNKNDFKVKRKN